MKALLIIFLLLLSESAVGQELQVDSELKVSVPQFLLEVSVNTGEVLRIDSEGRIIFHNGTIVVQPNGKVVIAEGVDITLAVIQFVGALEFVLESQGLKGILCSTH